MFEKQTFKVGDKIAVMAGSFGRYISRLTHVKRVTERWFEDDTGTKWVPNGSRRYRNRFGGEQIVHYTDEVKETERLRVVRIELRQRLEAARQYSRDIDDAYVDKLLKLLKKCLPNVDVKL